MITRLFIIVLLVGTGAWAAPPNVVWIVLDACRADHLSHHGYERDTTPFLARFASAGTSFLNHRSQAGYTVHSLPSYMTGRYFPVQCLSFLSPFETWREAPAVEQLAPEIFRDNGYATGLVSACPWIAPGGRLTEAFEHAACVPSGPGQVYAPLNDLTGAALAWLRTVDDRPFFLYIHAMDTHFPHPLRAGYDEWITGEPRAGLEEGAAEAAPFGATDQRHLVGLYDEALRYADLLCRNLFSSLHFRGFLDNTLVVIGADHGDVLGEDGYTIQHPPHVTSDEVYRVPLILRGPGIPAGHVVETMTRNVDILPTLTAILGLETSGEMDGVSLLPQLAADAAVHEPPFTLARHYAEDDFRVVLEGEDWKYIAGAEQSAPLWVRTPDPIAYRRGIDAPPPDATARANALWRTVVAPRWQQYRDQPLTRRSAFSIQIAAGVPSPEDAVSIGEDPLDGKWTLGPGGGVRCEPGERPAPLTLRFRVPNARYVVRLGALGDLPLPEATVEGGVARLPQEAPDERDQVIGELEVQSERVAITLRAGAAGAGARLLYFDPVDAASPAWRGEAASQREQLRALGYL